MIEITSIEKLALSLSILLLVLEVVQVYCSSKKCNKGLLFDIRWSKGYVVCVLGVVLAVITLDVIGEVDMSSIVIELKSDRYFFVNMCMIYICYVLIGKVYVKDNWVELMTRLEVEKENIKVSRGVSGRIKANEVMYIKERLAQLSYVGMSVIMEDIVKVYKKELKEVERRGSSGLNKVDIVVLKHTIKKLEKELQKGGDTENVSYKHNKKVLKLYNRLEGWDKELYYKVYSYFLNGTLCGEECQSEISVSEKREEKVLRGLIEDLEEYKSGLCSEEDVIEISEIKELLGEVLNRTKEDRLGVRIEIYIEIMEKLETLILKSQNEV